MNQENALLLWFANNRAQKNHLKRGKSRFHGSTSSYFNSLGPVRGPGIYLSHLPTGGWFYNSTINNHTTSIPAMASGGDDDSFRPTGESRVGDSGMKTNQAQRPSWNKINHLVFLTSPPTKLRFREIPYFFLTNAATQKLWGTCLLSPLYAGINPSNNIQWMWAQWWNVL